MGPGVQVAQFIISEHWIDQVDCGVCQYWATFSLFPL